LNQISFCKRQEQLLSSYKNKSDIKGYDEWYPKNVIEKWNGDHIMTWAKNSRNTIEKEGDLLKCTVRQSYNDIFIS
jgi:hypothetical protein